MPSDSPEMDLAGVTSTLGTHYTDWKQAEKDKNVWKDKFFAMATATVAEDHPLEEMLVTVDRRFAADEEAAQAYLAQYHPRFTVDALRLNPDPVDNGRTWEAILVENPAYVSYSFVNVEDGMVYTRAVQDGPMLLDEKLLEQMDFDLYETLCFELPWGQTVMRPLDQLEPTELAAVRTYLYHGKPTIKLNPPRKAKAEELEGME
jgi:hypothetical protein